MRKALTVILLAVTLLLTLAGTASAKPSFGQACSRLMPACVSIQ